MREGRLRWFGYVKRRPQSALVKRVESIIIDGARRKGRLMLRWVDRLKINLKELLLSEDMTSNGELELGSFLLVGALADVLCFSLFGLAFIPICSSVGSFACPFFSPMRYFSACLLVSLPLYRYAPLSMSACMVLGFYACLLLLYASVFVLSLLWYVVMHFLMPEVFLEAVPLPSGKEVTVYIPPPPYVAPAGLGNVVVVESKPVF
ncbi:hypothetical protein Tco_0385671 [Tanacetum coccineum]